MNTDAIVQIFQKYNRFLLLIHHSPDGDAIASSLALGLALRSSHKIVDIVCSDPIPLQFQFLPGVHTIKHDFLVGDYDAIVTLDCGDSKRTGFRSRLQDLMDNKRKVLINIDHHPKNDLHALATHNFVDDSAPSTSFLVDQLLADLGVGLNYKIATCLLTGLYTDTGGFKHPNTTPDALTFAARLLSAGARLKDITSHITQVSSVQRLKLWGVALSRVQKHNDLDIISTFITEADMQATGSVQEDLAGIATLLSTIPAKMAVLVIQMADQTVQVRMRTKNRQVNVGDLAIYLGGGGQKRTAGFAIKSNLDFKLPQIVTQEV